MTYHQIMPSFLDLVFSFGAQHHAKDFHFTGFRQDSRLGEPEKGIDLPALGRSGRNLRLCYSLRSVEPSPGQENWPWSIRGLATHHAFDFETGRASWLIMKGEGGASMKERIMKETSPPNGGMLDKFGSRDQAFSSSMSSHLLLCQWSAENWRWYINYLEEQVQAITRKTLSVKVTRSPEPRTQPQFIRIDTGDLVPSKRTPTSKSLSAQRQQSVPLTKMATAPPTQGPLGPPSLAGTPGPPPRLSEQFQTTNSNPFHPHNEFSFEDLKRIEYIEEHANGALLVMTLNGKILSALVQHYTFVMESTSCPYDLKTECATDFRRFVSGILHISAEIDAQEARVQTLLRLLTDRKALVWICSSMER